MQKDDMVRSGVKKEILGFIPIITSPIGLDRLPERLLDNLHQAMRDAVMWIKASNADDLEE